MLDGDRIRSLLSELCNTIEADWLLVGGALVTLWLEERRRTDDLDLVGLAGTNEERYQLYDFLHARGLPYEIINTGVDFVVKRIPDWRDHLEVFIEGSRGTVYRPTPTLFLLTKIGRLSEQDLTDCKALLDRCRREGSMVDARRVSEALAQLPSAAQDTLDRRRQLQDLLAV